MRAESAVAWPANLPLILRHRCAVLSQGIAALFCLSFLIGQPAFLRSAAARTEPPAGVGPTSGLLGLLARGTR